MKLFTIPEVANDILSVGRTTVYRLVKAGKLRLVHVRGCARITSESVNHYLKNLESGVK